MMYLKSSSYVGFNSLITYLNLGSILNQEVLRRRASRKEEEKLGSIEYVSLPWAKRFFVMYGIIKFHRNSNVQHATNEVSSHWYKAG
jgi:hypothetical protein